MVSVKLLVLVALFATVSCDSHYRHDRGEIEKVKNTISSCIGQIFEDITPSPRICDSDAQKELLKPRTPKDIYDIIEFLIHLIQGLGGFLDNHVHGLGSLTARIGIALARISVCKYGSNRFHKQPYLCYRNFDQFGVKGIGHDVDDICNELKVNKAVEQVNTYIGNFTKQKGAPLYERERVMFQISWNLAFLIDDRVSLNANTFSKLVIQVSISIGVVGNALQYSLCDEIGVDVLKTCHPILVKYGFIGVIDMKGYVKNTISLSYSPVKEPDADKPDDDQGDNDSDEWNDSNESDRDKSDGQGQGSGNGQSGGQGSEAGQSSGQEQGSRNGQNGGQRSGE